MVEIALDYTVERFGICAMFALKVDHIQEVPMPHGLPAQFFWVVRNPTRGQMGG